MKLEQICDALKKASSVTAALSAGQKNEILKSVALALDAERSRIIVANSVDVERARAKGMKEALVDRLVLNDQRIDGMISSIHEIIAQKDPIGELVSGWNAENGLAIRQVRVPLGVVAIIYESRPNVTIDAFSLAFKSGNAILLRGSSSASESNTILVQLIKNCLKESGLEDAIALSVCDTHDDVDWILKAVGKIDVVLPRGNAPLINHVVQNARIPVIETGSGVCHLFVDASADCVHAAVIAANAKLQRPGVCNAIETCLVHKDCADVFLSEMHKTFAGRAEFRCCKRSYPVMASFSESRAVKAGPQDFGCEFLDNILAVKIVDSVEEAIEHINTHTTHHSESILTKDYEHARLFQKAVDSACVYVNASTRFTDGGVFGFGAELGISTQKLHIRGPMGLVALTTTKYLIDGEGQIR